MAIYLGLDSSTQSLGATVIDTEDRRILTEHSINFDADLPQFETQHGTLPHTDPAVVHAPPLLWVAALERLLTDLGSRIDLSTIAAVSGSGQQHGSVYLSRFPKLDPARNLTDNLRGCFSRPTSPIWMDSSTDKECAEIRAALGGMQATTEATGSNTFERFTGPQIRRFAREEPEAYANTRHIMLVSSFMASLLGGKPAPIDPGDGAGMNLMDIAHLDWHADALEATAPDLASRLPAVAPSWTDLGSVDTYFVEQHGFSPDCRHIIWSGDNPCSVIGLGLIHPGMTAISLGTSDTLFGTMAQCSTDPNGEGHVFGSPVGGYMTLICFKNGSLAREAVKDAFDLDWKGFSAALRDTTPGNRGAMMLPWFEPEIVPRVLTPGVQRRNLDPSEVPANCRAVVEAQMMSMRIHSEWMGEAPTQIFATGGASANREILQVMADVHQCPVHRFETTNSAALGAALRAAHAHSGQTWEEVVSGFTEPVAGSEVQPDPDTRVVYESTVAAYRAFEQEHTGT